VLRRVHWQRVISRSNLAPHPEPDIVGLAGGGRAVARGQVAHAKVVVPTAAHDDAVFSLVNARRSAKSTPLAAHPARPATRPAPIPNVPQHVVQPQAFGFFFRPVGPWGQRAGIDVAAHRHFRHPHLVIVAVRETGTRSRPGRRTATPVRSAGNTSAPPPFPPAAPKLPQNSTASVQFTRFTGHLSRACRPMGYAMIFWYWPWVTSVTPI